MSQPRGDQPNHPANANSIEEDATFSSADSRSENSERTENFLEPQGEISAPKAFGRYRVVSILGKGGFGAVYRAFDDQLQRDVAIKVTLGNLIDPSLRQGFLNEARIVASLDHPNIVPVHDVGKTDQGDFFVVSKLIDGSNLSSRIKSDRLERTLALRIVEHG
jgi:serine/threonine protein kinase